MWRLWRGCAIIALLVVSIAILIGSDDAAIRLASVWLNWMPFLLSGFLLNILMSIATILLGTLAGALLCAARMSSLAWLDLPARAAIFVLRCSPWLIIQFGIMLLLPFRLHIGEHAFMVPDWGRAVIGFALPIMANLAEIFRGAVASIPASQWDAADALGLSRMQTLRLVIVPQCVKRALPGWMNWLAIVVVTTPVAAILGIQEGVARTQQAIQGAGSSYPVLVMFYVTLLLFFVFCYPISLLTRRLERRYPHGN